MTTNCYMKYEKSTITFLKFTRHHKMFIKPTQISLQDKFCDIQL